MRAVFSRLHAGYGPQHWWPADGPFEVMVGAILTQNTAWTNVEQALANLKARDWLGAEAILTAPVSELAECLRPSGYFNVKAQRLRAYCRWYTEQGGLTALSARRTEVLRRELLAVPGIGPETADDILLYAFHRPVFVIDAYTRRLFARLGRVHGDEPYEALRALFENELGTDGPGSVALFNEYHALIVVHAKDVCRKRQPRCAACCLRADCRESVGQ